MEEVKRITLSPNTEYIFTYIKLQHKVEVHNLVNGATLISFGFYFVIVGIKNHCDLISVTKTFSEEIELENEHINKHFVEFRGKWENQKKKMKN